MILQKPVLTRAEKMKEKKRASRRANMKGESKQEIADSSLKELSAAADLVSQAKHNMSYCWELSNGLCSEALSETEREERRSKAYTDALMALDFALVRIVTVIETISPGLSS